MSNILKEISNLDKQRSAKWQEYYDLFERFHREKESTFSAVKEEYNNTESITKKYKHLRELDDVVWQVYDNAVDGLNKYVENDHLFTLNSKICTPCYISRKKATQIEANTCSLCLESHSIKHIVRTSCGHIFGKQCFAALMRHKYYEDIKQIGCPNCRANNYSLCVFKYKK